MLEMIITGITFYGGLIALGFVTKWYIPLILFVILYGHASHLDWLFLRKRDLRRELAKLVMEDLSQMEAMFVHPDMEANLDSVDKDHLH